MQVIRAYGSFIVRPAGSQDPANDRCPGGKDNYERLVIFTSADKQEWRWPRRARLGSANACYLCTNTSSATEPRISPNAYAPSNSISTKTFPWYVCSTRCGMPSTTSLRPHRLLPLGHGHALHREISGVGGMKRPCCLPFVVPPYSVTTPTCGSRKVFSRRYLRDHTRQNLSILICSDYLEVLNTKESQRDLPLIARMPTSDMSTAVYSGTAAVAATFKFFSGGLLDACDFDWSVISPAVFGSMFQTVKSREAGVRRRTLHQQVNILRTIRPLFLDEYSNRLEEAWDDKAKLRRLHSEIGQARF